MLTLRQILCPTDFSDLSYEALRIASHLATRFDARLDVLHVVAHNGEESNAVEKTDAPGQKTESASSGLIKVAAEKVTLPHKVIPRTLTRLGKPALEIMSAAQETNTDLIVMGTHGVTGWRHLVLGSVTEAVVRLAPCPVLTIRETREVAEFYSETPRKILCSTDFSEESYEGLKIAINFAKEFGAELILMNAVEPFSGYSGLILEPAEIETFTIEETTQRLDGVLAIRAPDDVQTRPLAVWGGAAEAIVQSAHQENADMIVIATHGVTGWRHLLLGSVAETVVQTAPCPVLTVPVHRPVNAPAATTSSLVAIV